MLVRLFLLSALMLSCSADLGGSGSGDSPAGGATSSDFPEAIIREVEVSETEIGTADSGKTNCTILTFEALDGSGGDAKPLTNVSLAFRFEHSAKTKKNIGTLDPETATTDNEGRAKTKYCAGSVEGDVTVYVAFGTISTNSSPIGVTGQQNYKFEFVAAEIPGIEAAAKLINLNVFDSTSSDCTSLFFRLSAQDKPLKSETLEFSTPPNYPKGFKLAEKSDPAKTKVDPKTNRKYLYDTATSNAKGVFKVPVCAGTELGTTVVRATYVADDGSSYPVASPILKVNSGVTSYGSFSLLFADQDSRSLIGNFSSNTTQERTILIQTGTDQNGFPVDRYSVNVASEYGYSEIVGSVTPDASGIVNFKLNQSHLAVTRPFEVNRFSEPLARTRCDVEALANNTSVNGTASTADIFYKDITKNWRSTVTYYTQGAEQFFDANNNGKYDVGGDGFWDKNQNGIYDSGDVLTLDNNSNGQADGEWFIDLPSPFVDTDENGIYNPLIDKLVGDDYQAPNGKWDGETQIWRSRVFPLYFRPSVYSITRARIMNGDFNDASVDTVGSDYFTDLHNRGFDVRDRDSTGGFDPPEIFGVTAYSVTDRFAKDYWYYFHLHDVCGNPVAGGSDVSVTFVALNPATYGDRELKASFYIQPSDDIREPSRHLLRGAQGGATAKSGYDVVDHPAATASYPVTFLVQTAACTNPCTGTVSGAGFACDAKSGQINLTVDGITTTGRYDISSVTTCTCVTGIPIKGVCQ